MKRYRKAWWIDLRLARSESEAEIFMEEEEHCSVVLHPTTVVGVAYYCM